MKRFAFVIMLWACSPQTGATDAGHNVQPGDHCARPNDCVTGATCVAPAVCAVECTRTADGGAVCGDGGACETLSVVGCCPGCSCEAAAVCGH